MLSRIELETLQSAMHDIQYVVPGRVISFTMEFNECTALVEWDEDYEAFHLVDIVR